MGLSDVGVKDAVGVWVQNERKLGFIGIPRPGGVLSAHHDAGFQTRRWITLHGIALNVNNDLVPFEHIVPCGEERMPITSIARELRASSGGEELLGHATTHLLDAFGRHFGVHAFIDCNYGIF